MFSKIAKNTFFKIIQIESIQSSRFDVQMHDLFKKINWEF